MRQTDDARREPAIRVQTQGAIAGRTLVDGELRAAGSKLDTGRWGPEDLAAASGGAEGLMDMAEDDPFDLGVAVADAEQSRAVLDAHRVHPGASNWERVMMEKDQGRRLLCREQTVQPVDLLTAESAAVPTGMTGVEKHEIP